MVILLLEILILLEIWRRGGSLLLPACFVILEAVLFLGIGQIGRLALPSTVAVAVVLGVAFAHLAVMSALARIVWSLRGNVRGGRA